MPSCIYPDDQWGAEFVASLSAPIKYLPPDWRARVNLPAAPDDNQKDCAELVEIIKERPDYRAAIEAEAVSRAAAIRPVLAIMNLYRPPIRKKTIDMVYAVLDEVLAPTFIVKKEFKRGRPWQCCAQPMDPMFRYTPLDPLHPAYPSGHSTQTHAVAEALALLQPQHRVALVAAADRVARNREVAGLHYPTDSACGALLGQKLVELLQDSPAFVKDYLEPARKEWA